MLRSLSCRFKERTRPFRRRRRTKGHLRQAMAFFAFSFDGIPEAKSPAICIAFASDH
jgi:hypothetical protein